MTFERYNYCKHMGYDVLAVTELWRCQEKFTNRTNEFTTSATVKDKNGNLVNKQDPAAGVGILLSHRAQQKVLGTGNNGSERICWVRLKGPVCNLFIVAVYMPHSSRVQPAQADTLTELDVICKQAKQGDCIVVLGDLNVQLPGNKCSCTGNYVCAQGETPEADDILNFMKSHDLFAINTKFRKRQSPATYLHVVSQGSSGVNDQHLGREVKVQWRGKDNLGEVVENFGGQQGQRKWRVRFKDGYVKAYSEPELDNILVLQKRKTEGRQLDYILVSNRWLTSVQDASVKWGPSEHRNIRGRADHALVCCKWTWRLQTCKPKKTKDFAILNAKTKEGRAIIAGFNEAVVAKSAELSKGDAILTVEQQYMHLCTAIRHAITTVLPDKKREKRTTRTVSKRTKDLFEKRTRLGKSHEQKRTKAEYKTIQKQIKESSLRDHADWVEKCAEEMAAANNVGDTRKLHALVKKLSGKEDKSPVVDIGVDKQGGVITNATERAKVWYDFLKTKFAATEAENERPAMPTIPARDERNVLTVEEVRMAVNGLKNHKAVGADGIPVEIYKLSAPAFHQLHKLLARIWREETVPTDMGMAIFKMLYKRKGSPNNPSKYRCIGLLNASIIQSAISGNATTAHEGDVWIPSGLAGRLQAGSRMS